MDYFHAYFMALATVAVAAMTFMNTNPTAVQDLEWMLFGRSVGIALVLFLAAITKDAKYLLVGFLLRLIADTMDIFGRVLSADEITSEPSFLLPRMLVLAPIYIGALKLWGIIGRS